MPEGAESEIDEEYLVQFTLRQRSSDINELIDNLEGRESRVMFSQLGDSRINAAAQPSQTMFLEALQREEAERRQREHRREQALETEQGKLVHKINNRMRNGRREIVEVRLASSETPNLALGLVGSGSLVADARNHVVAAKVQSGAQVSRAANS